MSGCDHLQQKILILFETNSFVVSLCVSVQWAYLEFDVVLDLLLLLIGVVGVGAHELRLQHVSGASVQVEEGCVQLGAFI